jgi:hypothetical protein
MGTLKYEENNIRYEIAYSYFKNYEYFGDYGSNSPSILIDSFTINNKDFTEEYETIFSKGQINYILNLIQDNL